MHTVTNSQKRIALSTIVFLLFIISCDENSITLDTTNPTTTSSGKNSANSRIGGYTFDGTEGGVISLDTASNWVNNYYTKNGNEITAFYFSKAAMEKILSKEGSMGIRFYYAMNDLGKSAMLAVGAYKNGNNLPDYRLSGELSSITLYEKAQLKFLGDEIDSVSEETSKTWVDNYKTDPSGIKAHFWGYQPLTQLISERDCVGIRCYYAFDAGSVTPKLVLIGVNTNGDNILPTFETTGGRVASDAVVLDQAYPCPAFCPGT